MRSPRLPLILLLLATACDQPAPCPAPIASKPVIHVDTSPAIVFPTEDPYQTGPFDVQILDTTRCIGAQRVKLRLFAPIPGGTYPYIQFQHGFQLLNTAYDDVLSQVASHGFVVIVPQMYEPGIASLFAGPTAEEEAELAEAILLDLPLRFDELPAIERYESGIGLAGHSRGGKVAWRVAVDQPERLRGLVGIDPVDGTGGPAMNQPRVVQGPFSFIQASLILGAGLGGNCAPAGDNHEQFYAASPMPSWHIVATNHGHGDMLDEDVAAAAALLCESNPDRESMRRLTAGLLVAFFRGVLQEGDASALSLINADAAPAAISIERNFSGAPVLP